MPRLASYFQKVSVYGDWIEGIRCKDTREGAAATWLTKGDRGMAERRKVERLQRQTGGIVNRTGVSLGQGERGVKNDSKVSAFNLLPVWLWVLGQGPPFGW